MAEAAAPAGFQYSDARHQAGTAEIGMWLFLASEVLFFGALFLTWIVCRHQMPAGFDEGARHTNLLIGTLNTLILISSSAIYTAGLAALEAGQVRWLIRCCALAWLCGAAFLVLKFGVEWHEDLTQGLFPGAHFAITGSTRAGAQLFYVFYFIGTALHGVHMLIGLALLLWIIQRARRGDFSASYVTPVAVVGLYWAFVDVVWMVLYPLIYLIGRSP